MLAAVGHEVIVAATADEALERCRDAAPDVTVLDVALCRDDGVELLERSSATPRPTAPRWSWSSSADLDLDTAVEALRRGVQDFLVEPFADAELVARVEAAGRTTVLQQELMAQAHRLEGLLFEDPLTGLSNRRFILTQLAGMVSAARRHGRAAGRGDRRHRPLQGDQRHATATRPATRCSPAVAAALRRRLRAEDQLGRLGGEEFLALLPDTDADAAATAAEKLRAEVAGTRRSTHDGDELRRHREHRLGRLGRRVRRGAAAPRRRGAVRGQGARVATAPWAAPLLALHRRR